MTKELFGREASQGRISILSRLELRPRMRIWYPDFALLGRGDFNRILLNLDPTESWETIHSKTYDDGTQRKFFPHTLESDLFDDPPSMENNRPSIFLLKTGLTSTEELYASHSMWRVRIGN